jgi:hypothetical protein
MDMRKLLLAAVAFGSMTTAAYASDPASPSLLNGVSNAILTMDEMSGIKGEGELVTVVVNTQTNVCAGVNLTCQQSNVNNTVIGNGNVVAVSVDQEQIKEMANGGAAKPADAKPDNKGKNDNGKNDNKGKKWGHHQSMKVAYKHWGK